MGRKKVLITLNNYRLHGIEYYSLLLAKHIDKNNYNITIAVPGRGQFCEILDNENINYIVFNRGSNKAYSIKGIINLYKYFRKNRFDIIHAQAGIVPCILGKLFRIKLIIEHKHGLDFTEEQIDEMRFHNKFYEKLKKYFVDYTITDCNHDKEILVNKFRYDFKKVIVIYNCIEKLKSDNNENKKINNKFTIGTIGRLTYQKGQEYFIEMANVLINEGFNYQFFIYGEGEKFYKYSELIKKYNIEDHVFLKGYTNNVYKALSEMDIFVLTSRYEGIPYVLLFAMNASVPIICTDVGGINEIIKHQENGILVEKENVDELVNQIKRLVNDKDLMISLKRNAKKNLEENYLIDKTTKSLERLYSSGSNI